MGISRFLSVVGILAMAIGFIMVAIPFQFLEFYGAPDPSIMSGITRSYGAALLSIGLTAWLARNETGPAVDAILVGIITVNAIGALNSVYGVWAEVLAPVGWINAGVQGTIAGVAAYLRFAGRLDEGQSS